jgi:thiol-disulfide isomerase/thioredoxin
MSGIIYIKTEEEFDKLKESENLLVVKFGASWCGPCKQIKPQLEKLLETIDNVIIIDIDVDDASESDWSWASDVENLPTFRFIKKGVQVEEYYGSKIEKIQDIIRKLS